MALKAGRVGVAPSQVDNNGNITGGGSSVTVVDNLNSSSSTDALSAKQGKVLNETKEDASKIGGLEFRNNEGTAQYRLSSQGEWLNFNSGSEDGLIVSEPIAPLNVLSGITISGGYEEVDGMVYIKMRLTTDATIDASKWLCRIPIQRPNVDMGYALVFDDNLSNVTRCAYTRVYQGSEQGVILQNLTSMSAGTYNIYGFYIKQ